MAKGTRVKIAPTNEHLEWLVKGRSRNQISALEIRKIMVNYKDKIYNDPFNESIIDDLTGINFSLWRAVFLSDLTVGSEHVFDDALKFMDELISNNTITYVQDRGSKEWSFIYYMSNARFRLEEINKHSKNLLPDAEFPEITSDLDKDWWEHHQNALDVAVKNFEVYLNEK
ncbi:hypothetical protein [Methylorubrum thiocyanatum]|uniref:hypothetical protein n=1 Tax=Methylorubrum thiocyanatum TaxID=47958 RepID=UPI003652C1BC